MIKKIALLVLLAVTLAACSSSRRSNGGFSNRALSPMGQLAIGTLKLDGTKNAITKDQASQLIPMWEVYKELIGSDTAAQQEIDGLSAQIQDTMTSDQRKAIQEMKLTSADMMTYMQQARGGTGTGANGQSSRSGTGGQGGNFAGPPGGFGGDFGGPPGGFPSGSTSRQSSGTQTANGTQSSGQNARPANMLDRVPTPLLQALIQYLHKMAGA